MTDRLNVSHLKTAGFGYDSPLWIGQIIMAAIEGVMLLLLIAVFLYTRMHFAEWPPPGANTQGLLLPALNLLLFIASCIPMHIGDKAVLRCDWPLVNLGMTVATAMGIVALAVQIYLWSRFEFTFSDHIYGSFVWMLLGVHTMHVCAALVETIVLGTLVHRGYKSDKVRQGLNVDEIYWFFVVISALFVYGAVFYGARAF